MQDVVAEVLLVVLLSAPVPQLRPGRLVPHQPGRPPPALARARPVGLERGLVDPRAVEDLAGRQRAVAVAAEVLPEGDALAVGRRLPEPRGVDVDPGVHAIDVELPLLV